MKSFNFPGLPRVLIIDSEATCENLRSMLQPEGIAVEAAPTVPAGARLLKEKSCELVFMNRDIGGTDAVPDLRQGAFPPDVVFLTGYGQPTSAVQAMRAGVSEVIEKPFSQDRVLSCLRRLFELRQLRSEVAGLRCRLQDFTAVETLGLSSEARELNARIEHVAQMADSPTLVVGGPGAGKELTARSIHERSQRRHGSFVTVNCASMTEASLEVVLFGHEPGVFRGASAERQLGLLDTAPGGTVFLDEISEVELSMQAKLLRVIEERAFRRVGGVEDIHADVRIIATSCKDLRAEVERGNFREDLFYRLNATPVVVPALADRAADVPLLAHFFLDQCTRQMGKPLTGFTEEAIETMCEHGWPGNIRELKNAVESAAMTCDSGMIDECHLPRFTGGSRDGSDEISRGALQLDMGDRSIRHLEGKLVASVLEDTEWNISKSAAILGINRTTLYNKIRVHDLGSRPRTATAS